MKKAYAHESITVADTAIGFTVGKINDAVNLHGRPAQAVIASLETAQIRFTLDGTTPTTTVGHLMEIGDVYEFDEQEARGFLAIRTGGSSGTLKVSFEV